MIEGLHWFAGVILFLTIKYINMDSLEITTLEDIVYLSYKNDVSFLFGHQMNLYEHQSSYNPNMPVRGLIYFAELYSGYIQKNKLDVYSTKQVNLPVPRYIIFYNGTKNEPEKKELRLSECFIKRKQKNTLTNMLYKTLY